MNKTLDKMTIIAEDGSEQEVRILFTFTENKKNYAVFEFEDTNEVSAVIYHPGKNDQEGSIEYIEDEAEWDLIDKVLDQYEKDLDELEVDDSDE